MLKVAIIVGGADNVFEEYDKTRHLLEITENFDNWETFVINAAIEHFTGHIDHAITLHPEKLQTWAHNRNKNKFLPPTNVWAHRPAFLITNHTQDWGGSSGLFAIKIAMELGFKKIILCGVPMTVEGKHFERKKNWDACLAFRRNWGVRVPAIKPYARSWSGWTKELLGEPTMEWFIT
jgi:hypothetical protein